jgi:hypothetical protein
MDKEQLESCRSEMDHCKRLGVRPSVAVERKDGLGRAGGDVMSAVSMVLLKWVDERQTPWWWATALPNRPRAIGIIERPRGREYQRQGRSNMGYSRGGCILADQLNATAGELLLIINLFICSSSPTRTKHQSASALICGQECTRHREQLSHISILQLSGSCLAPV